MKSIYCASCGKQLAVIRKAVPKLATIIDLAEPHQCGDVLLFSGPTDKVPKFVTQPNDYEFVKLLNELEPPKVERPLPIPKVERENKLSQMTGTDDLRDRRFEADTKSSAPNSVLDMIKSMHPSEPSNDIPLESEEPND